MLFNEIDNFIELYNNSVNNTLIQCFGKFFFFGRIDQISTKELGPKTLYSFSNL